MNLPANRAMPTQAEVDAAKRISDAVNLHSAFDESIGKYVVVSLADGRSPDSNTLYDRYAPAVKSVQNRSERYGVIRIPADGMPLNDALRWLQLMREIDKAGFRMTDPDGPAPVLPQTTEQLIRAMRNPLRNVRFSRRVN